MYLFNIYVGLPVAFFYSLITSYILLSYFQNKKKTNMLLFYFGVLHLSFLFLMPIICITIVLLPTEDFLIQYNEKVYSYIIDIISYANHALNKLIYPIIKIYCQSGYISAKYKFIHISLKDWILEFFDFWYSIIIIIVSLILRAVSEEQANVFEFLLNYLNILDLIKVYIEIAYSIGNLTLYYNKVIKLKEEYKYFIIGKISIFRRKKIESFKKHFKTLCQLNLTYIKDNAKFNSLSEIPTFIDKIKSEQYFKEEELGLIEPEFLDENMTRKKLEDLISEPYEKCKEYSRKLDRIKNVKEDVLGQKEPAQDERCIDKLFKCCKCCKTQKCEKILFWFFAFLCSIILLQDVGLHMSSIFNEVNNDRICNSTSVYETIEQQENFENVFSEIIACLIGYPIIYFALSLATGVFILPLLYALINRRSITGNFLYVRNSSDTIDLAESLGKITEMIFPTIYLSSVLYGMIYYAPTNNKKNLIFDVDCLFFFEIPEFKLIFYYKYIPILFFIFIMRYFESINLKCLKFKVHISDECYFDPRNCDVCCQEIYKERREEYIDEGRKEMGNTYGELNPILINQSNIINAPIYTNNVNYNANNMNYIPMNNNIAPNQNNNNYMNYDNNNTYNNYNNNINYNYPTQVGFPPNYPQPLLNNNNASN
jgi:hypothetical protein